MKVTNVRLPGALLGLLLLVMWLQYGCGCGKNGGESDSSDEDSLDDEVSCIPECDGAVCGDPDGCGGACDGTCPDGEVCAEDGSGRSCCAQDCAGRTCGDDDGCGGVCRACPDGGSCCGDSCVYLASDEDNCGTCGSACDSGELCVSGVCQSCVPDCTDMECGVDGCGGGCGTCGTGTACIDNQCETCIGSCEGVDCGDDGCGHLCGDCEAGYACVDGSCLECTADCADKDCGDDDGCSGRCRDGDCPAGGICVEGICVGRCTPDCVGWACGNDGCGGTCGECEYPSSCESGSCGCAPQCVSEGWYCGWDGCWGSCGDCGTDEFCGPLRICVDDPSIIGCADGIREGFTNIDVYTDIAACGGTFPPQSLRTDRTGALCGNNIGPCLVPEDICAPGWHICMRNGWPGDLTDRITEVDCYSANAGSDAWVAAASVIDSHSGCDYTLPVGCYNDIAAVCCGMSCTYLDTAHCGCNSLVWTDATPNTVFWNGCEGYSCGYLEWPQGVLCCEDPPISGH